MHTVDPYRINQCGASAARRAADEPVLAGTAADGVTCWRSAAGVRLPRDGSRFAVRLWSLQWRGLTWLDPRTCEHAELPDRIKVASDGSRRQCSWGVLLYLWTAA
jgi:hypothetical protein